MTLVDKRNTAPFEGLTPNLDDRRNLPDVEIFSPVNRTLVTTPNPSDTLGLDVAVIYENIIFSDVAVRNSPVIPKGNITGITVEITEGFNTGNLIITYDNKTLIPSELILFSEVGNYEFEFNVVSNGLSSLIFNLVNSDVPTTGKAKLLITFNR